MKSHRRPPQPVTVHGVTYKSLSAAAKAFGVVTATASGRLRAGMSPEAAFGPPPKPRIDFKSLGLAELAEKHHLVLGTVLKRYRNGLRGDALVARPHSPDLPRKKYTRKHPL